MRKVLKLLVLRLSPLGLESCKVWGRIFVIFCMNMTDETSPCHNPVINKAQDGENFGGKFRDTMKFIILHELLIQSQGDVNLEEVCLCF